MKKETIWIIQYILLLPFIVEINHFTVWLQGRSYHSVRNRLEVPAAEGANEVTAWGLKGCVCLGEVGSQDWILYRVEPKSA